MSGNTYTPVRRYTTREAITERMMLLAVRWANFVNYARYGDYGDEICDSVFEHNEDRQVEDLQALREDYLVFVLGAKDPRFVETELFQDAQENVMDKYNTLRHLLTR